MPHPVTCGACNAAFSIPDDVWEKRVEGQVATLKCRQCKAPILIDGRTRKSSSSFSTESKRKEESVPNEPHAQPALSPVPLIVQGSSAAPTDTKSGLKARAQASLPEGAGTVTASDKRQPTNIKFTEPKRLGAQSSGSTLNATPEIARRPTGSAESEVSQPKHDAPVEARGTPAVAFSATKSPKQALSPANRDPASPRTAEPSRSKVASSTGAAVIVPREASTTKTVGIQRKLDTKSSPSPDEKTRDRKADYSWIVSVDPDNDREMTMAQISAAIADGTITQENIVWREGMSEWAPISTVPELKHLAKHANVVGPSAGSRFGRSSPSDGSEDETFVYRPENKVANMASAGTATAKSSASTAKSTAATRRDAGVVRDGADVAKVAKQTGESHRDSPAVPAARAAIGPVKGGGPPPLRKALASTPDERADAATSEEERARPAQSLGVLAGMGTRNAGTGPRSPAGGPPPLPQQPGSLRTALAEPRDIVLHDHSPASLPVVTALEPPRLPAAVSAASSPSDIAALMRMRPKFPKWLPFAALGGIVLLAAVFAGMSWFGNDNVSESGKSTASRDKGGAPVPAGTNPGINNINATGSGPESVKTSENRESSSGFANQFAQAAAKQRPTSHFERESAEKALTSGFAKAAACHNKGEPTGNVAVTLSISPSGQILSVTVPAPFAGTFTADCIRNALAELRVPPFQGAPARLAHSISIR